MKRIFVLLSVIALLICMCACQKAATPDVTVPTLAQTEKPTENQTESTQAPTQIPTEYSCSYQSARISGSFTVTVRNVLPDYLLDDVTPSVAVVTPYQSNLFALDVSQEIAGQLEIGKTYVFTVNTVFANYSKDMLQKLGTAALFELIPELQVTAFRLAEENEIGLESLQLTIE